MRRASCGFKDEGAASGRDLLVSNGPSILVDIGFDQEYHPGTGVRPIAGASGINALIDTGATESHIDVELAKELRLPRIDVQRNYGGAAGSFAADIFLAQIHVPSLPHTVYGQFAGVNLTGGGQLHRAILGRTFLRRFTMVYNGVSGEVELTADP
jgi:predicted aspartyl protease